MSSEKSGGAPLAPPPPPPLPPVGHRHPPALRGGRPGCRRRLGPARPRGLGHPAAAPAPRPARPRLRGAPARLRHPAPHAARPLPAGDSLRRPAAPAARRRRPAAAGAPARRPGARLRGAHARRGGRHAAAGGLRGPRLPAAAAALHRLRAGLPGGHALRRRDPGGHRGDPHAPPAAPGPRAGPAGAEAPAARLHAHRSADHHLLLLAHRHHRHLQGGAGAHGLGPRRHGVGRDRVTRGPELLLHLPGRGHRSHGALYHPHRGHHHRRAAPRQLLGSLRTPRPPAPCAPRPPRRFCRRAAGPTGAPHAHPGATGLGLLLPSAPTQPLAFGRAPNPVPQEPRPSPPPRTPRPWSPARGPAAVAPDPQPLGTRRPRSGRPAVGSAAGCPAPSPAPCAGPAPPRARPRLRAGRPRLLEPAGRFRPGIGCVAPGPAPEPRARVAWAPRGRWGLLAQFLVPYAGACADFLANPEPLFLFRFVLFLGMRLGRSPGRTLRPGTAAAGPVNSPVGAPVAAPDRGQPGGRAPRARPAHGRGAGVPAARAAPPCSHLWASVCEFLKDNIKDSKWTYYPQFRGLQQPSKDPALGSPFRLSFPLGVWSGKKADISGPQRETQKCRGKGSPDPAGEGAGAHSRRAPPQHALSTPYHTALAALEREKVQGGRGVCPRTPGSQEERRAQTLLKKVVRDGVAGQGKDASRPQLSLPAGWRLADHLN